MEKMEKLLMILVLMIQLSK